MPRKLDRRIEAIDMDDGRYIVMLRPGFACQDANTRNAVHTFGADTQKEIREQMRDYVVACACHDCTKALAGSGKLWS